MSPKLRAALGGAGVLLLVAVVAVARLDSCGELQIPASEAAGHVGQRAVVCGEVASARFAPSVGGEPTFLDLERPYPHQLLTVVIWGKDRARFGESPEERFREQRICVRGRIHRHRGTPEIVVRSPRQIEVVGGEGR